MADDISQELEELDSELYKVEEELDKRYQDFLKLILLAFLFRLRGVGDLYSSEIEGVFQIDSVYRRDLERVYADYFKKITVLAEKYTKAELLEHATTNAQRRRIERIKSRQALYNKRYAAKLSRKQMLDLQAIVRNSVITYLNEQPHATQAAIKNVIRENVKSFAELRSAITSATEANRVTNAVRLELFKKSKIVKAVRFTAVLDKRTSAICRSRHGTIIPIRSTMLPSYTPPLHPRCRSYLVPIDITDPVEVATYSELEDIRDTVPATPTAEVVNSW